MVLQLPRPPEPPRNALKSRVDTSGLDEFWRQETGDNWKLKKAVPSYLWSEHWKETLKTQGITWQEFQSLSPTWAIEEWANGSEPWNFVLDKYKSALDARMVSTWE